MAVDNLKSNVKIVIGSHGSGKSDWLYNRFISMSRKLEAPSKLDLTRKLYLVVPEQDTNEKQRTMMKKMSELGHGMGILNIDVVSFDRIAHNVFDILNIEPLKESIIDDEMKTMILSLILSKLAKAEKLKYCGKMLNKLGFARKLTQVVSEFYAYNVSDEEIDKVISDKKSDAYKNKLNDLKLIFNEFKSVLLDMNFSIKEDKYDLLDKRISDVDIFKNAIVAFDGFTGFTPVQLSIFNKIADVAKEVYVSIDYRSPKDIKNFDINGKIDEVDVFYLSKKFIKDIAKIRNVKDISELLFEDSIRNTLYKYNDENKRDLKYIEENIYKYENIKYDKIDVKNIECYEANDVRNEVSNVVQIIFDLVRNKGYKYNDIKIVVPQIDNYRDVIIKSFDKYKIPLFIDDSEGVLNSPYVESIRSAIDVVNYNFSYDSVMRYINSGLIEKGRNVYEFDNFLQEHAIVGYERYKHGFDKINIKEDVSDSINTVREDLLSPLISLYEEIKNSETHDISSYIGAVENFIRNSKIDEKYDILESKVLDLKKDDSSFDRLSAILKYSKEVISKTINDLSNLEKYKNSEKDMYLNSDLSIEEFRRLFDVGLSEKSIKNIPYSLDQIVVGDLMRSRFDNPKVEIFMGLNQSSIPIKNNDTNLIDDAIRKLFANNIKELSQTTIETMLNQRFYIYLVLTNPTEKLILSYTKVNSDGETDDKSSVLSMIENLFNNEKDEKIFDIIKVDEDMFKFYNHGDLISYVAKNMQDIKNYNKKDNDGKFKYEFSRDNERKIVRAKSVLNYIKKDDNYDYIYSNILNQTNFYHDLRLNKELNKDLRNNDDKDFMSSATDIEKFNNCPYKYFLEKNLKLYENKVYAINPYDIGNIAHDVFESIFKTKGFIKKDKESIYKIIDDTLELKYQKEDVFNEFNKKDKNYIGSNKLEYIKGKIKDLMHYSTDILIDISKGMKFGIDKLEMPFEYKINGDIVNQEIVLTGKIDRIDIFSVDGKTYVNIIDYKSGMKEKSLDLKEVEGGTNIQLTLYADYCINNEYNKNSEAIFTGSFYFWVGKNKIRIEKYNDGEVDIELNNKGNTNIGLSGIVSSDEEVLKSVYNNPVIEKKQKGGIKSANLENGYKLDGHYLENSEFDELVNTMHEKVTKTVNDIKSGVISARPYKENMCETCQYANICRKEQQVLDGESQDAV